MLVGIDPRHWLDPQQGRKAQRLQTTTQGLVAVMEQGKVVVRTMLLRARDGRLEAGDNWRAVTLLVEPTRQEMHADTRQMGRDLDQRPAGTHRTAQAAVARSAFGPMQLPLDPQAVEMAYAPVHGDRALGTLVEDLPAGALRMLVEYLPPPGQCHDTEFPARLKGWTGRLHQGRLAQGD